MKNLRFAMGQSREGTIFLHFVGKCIINISRQILIVWLYYTIYVREKIDKIVNM